MDSSILFDIVTTVTVVAGVLFAALEVRHMNRQREHANMLALINSFNSADFNRALVVIYNLPEGLDKQGVEDNLGKDTDDLFTVLVTLETFGVLLHRGEVTIDLLDDLFSGPIVVTWQKLGRYIEEMRVENNRETIGEWVQWLAEQMMLREADKPAVPAHIEHRDWRPPN